MWDRLIEWFGPKPRIDKFASMLIERFEEFESLGWTYDKAESTLTHSDGAVINLGNIFVEYSRARRSERAGLMEKYASFAVIQGRKIPELWELAAKSIYPVVRSRYELVTVKIDTRGKDEFPGMISFPLCADLEVRIAYDWGSHVTQVQEKFLDTWGQSAKATLQRARQNLAALPRTQWREIGGGVFELESEGGYQESMFLLDKVVDQLKFADSAAVLPSNRGVLLACDGARIADVVEMIGRAEENHEKRPWPISTHILARRDGTWLPYDLSGEAADRAGDFHRIDTARTYEAQKRALEAHYQKINLDIYVATYSLFRREKDGNVIRSWCSWADGIVSSLPKSDFIILGRMEEKGSDPIVLRWEDAKSLLGHLMTRTEDDPERYNVESRLTAAEWESIRGVGES